MPIATHRNRTDPNQVLNSVLFTGFMRSNSIQADYKWSPLPLSVHLQFGQLPLLTSKRLGRLAFTIRIRIAAGVSRLRLAAWRGFILRRALGLNRLSHKSSIRLNFPFDQALRAILECVGERI